MCYYKLNTDVYIVKGAYKHAIYDLTKEFLYNIHQAVLDLIEDAINKPNILSFLDQEGSDLLNQLVSQEILVPCTNKEPSKDILSLRENILPSFAWIEVTRKCNLSCKFCYEESSPYCNETMKMEDFYYLCDQLKDIGVKKIQFIGGEPMVIKNDLKIMIEYARPYFDLIEVYTNGVLFNEDWAKFYKMHNIALAFSIHSYIPKEHDKVTTVRGSHKKVINALDIAKKYNLNYRIGTVANIGCKLGSPSEKETYTLNPSDPKLVGRADLSQYNLAMFKRKAITKESKSYPISKKRVVTALSGHQCFMKDLYINTKLEVYPCVMERRRLHGSLNKSNKLSKIINEDIRTFSKDKVQGCQDCEFRYACFDCRPDANGRDFFQKPWYCTYNPYSGEWKDPAEFFKELTNQKATSYKSIPIKQNFHPKVE